MNNSNVMAQLYQGGFSLREVAAILGVDRKLVRSRLESQGVEIRPSNAIRRSEWLEQRVKAGNEL